MKGKTIIFPHVPKSGGTSLKIQLEQSGLKTFMDYDWPPGLSPWLRKNSDRRNAEFKLLDFSNFDLVFGHFPIERYDSGDYRYVALVRDPYDRVISQLNYLFFRARKTPPLPDVRALAQLLESGELSPSEWVRKHGPHAMYRQYLGYWPRERFALVGDTSGYGDFIEGLRELLGIQLDAGVRERQSQGTEFEISWYEEKRIRWFLREEYKWYKEFTRGISR